MKALLLCAGYGRRLMPITKNTPKCMVKFKNKTLLEIWIDKIINLGVNEILINTHYLSNVLNEHVNSLKQKKKIKIITTFEKELLGTAGTLIKNINFIENDECLFLHSDNYCEDDLINFVISHKNRHKDCELSMLTFITSEPQHAGIVSYNNKNILIQFDEKPFNPKSNEANGAIYILSKKFIKSIKTKQYKDFSLDIIPKFVGKINCYKTEQFFLDIGTKKNYEKVKIRLKKSI